MKKAVLITLLLALVVQLNSQERVITVGVQVKPLFSSKFFGTGPITLNDKSYEYGIIPKSGYALGMVVRRGFTSNLSLEFGLNYAVRKFELSASNGINDASADIRIVGYEIPVSQLIFIRLSENIYMNAAAGLCINMFPTDVYKDQETFLVYAGKTNLIQLSLIANIGFEYRTKEKGYFYFGASLNRPFSSIYEYRIDYLNKKDVLNSASTRLNGNYLSLDFKYFFHEDPEKKSRSKARK